MIDSADVFVGIDTSNYTTSVCAIDAEEHILFEDRRVLKVPAGARGLMQSEAVFQHVVGLPPLLSDLATVIADKRIVAVGVSDRPREMKGSYMPVFHAGVLAATALAAGSGAKLIESTHQAGHIAAGIKTADDQSCDTHPFLVLHLSGGTTDVLLADPAKPHFAVQEVVTGLDLHVGQYVDRVGVMLGLPFPAGKHMEKLASSFSGTQVPLIPSSVKDGCPSFSGPLSAAVRMFENGTPPEALAVAVERSIATTLEKMIRFALDKTGVHRVLLVGGVASNKHIRQRLIHRFGGHTRAKRLLSFSDPRFASDNALGISILAHRDGLWMGTHL